MLRRAALFGKRALPAGALLAGVWLVAGQAWGQATPTHTFTLSFPSTTLAEPASSITSHTFTIQRDTSAALMDGEDIVITVSVAGSGTNPASVTDFRNFASATDLPSATVTFSGTDQMGSFNISLAADDLNEAGETFTFSFSIATEHMPAVTANGGATLPGDHTVTITDNADDAISVSIAQSNTDADMSTTGTQVREGRVALFTVTLSKVSTAAVSVPYTIGGDVTTTGAMADFTDAGGGTLSIPLAGGLTSTTGVIRIELALDADTTAEDLTVTLGATASEYSAAGTIARTSTAADQSATISVVSRPGTATRTLTVTPAAGPHPEGDANANHTFTVSFASGDTAFASDTEVAWSIVHGTTNAEDFTETSGVVTIPMGSTADVDFMVTIVGDNVNEDSESFGVSLTAPDTMTELGNDPGDSSMVIISDDDPIVLTFSGGGPVAEDDGRVEVMLDFGAVLSRTMVVRIGTRIDADDNTANPELSDVGSSGTAWLPAGLPALLRGQINNPLFMFDRGAGDDPISGTTTGQISHPTLTNDNFNEANEVFLVILEELPTGAHGPVTIVGLPQTYTIVDDDVMTLSVTADKSAVNEGQAVQFSFELTGAERGTLADLNLLYTLTGTSGFTPAVSGDQSDGVFLFDAGRVGGVLRGETSGAITVTIPRVSALGDSDPAQTLTLTVIGTERADSTTAQGDDPDPRPGVINLPDPRTTEVTVNFVDARHSFGFSSPTRRIGETDSDVTTTYTVTRSAEGGAAISSGGSITITWAYAAGTTNPVSNMDFASDTAPAGGTLVFTASETSETFQIMTKGDDLNEADETFTLTLSIASGDMAAATAEMGASLPASGLTVAIADDDRITLSASAAAGSVAEGDDIVITVALSAATPTADIVFPYGILPVGGSVASVSATAADYTDSAGGSITIPSSMSSGTITISITDDDLNEVDERLLVISGPRWREPPTTSGAVLVTGAELFFTLTDNDDALLSIAADATSTTEGETAEFTVTTDHESAGDIRVAWTAAVSNQQGTANPMSNPDIAVTSGTATIAAGDTTASIEIPVRFDNNDEGSTAETLTVTLGAVSFPAGTQRAGTVTVNSMSDDASTNLVNLNAARRISVGVADATVDEGGEIQFQIIVRGRPITTAFDVAWSLAAGTAQAADYSGPGASGTVTFAASSSMLANEERTETVRVTAVDDALMEGAETLEFSFSDPCPAMGVCEVGGRPSGFAASAPTMEAPSAEADRTVTATINASDSPVTLQIAGPGGALEEALASAQSAAEATFTISFTESVTTTAEITVGWQLAFPAAVPGPDGTRVVPASAADFARISRDGGTVAIPAGSSSVEIMIATMADLIQEPEESFAVELVAGSASGGGGIVGSGLSISSTMNSAAATIEASDDGGSSGVMSVNMAATMATQTVDEGNDATFSVQLVRAASTPPDVATDAMNRPTSSVPVDVTYTVSITAQQGGTAADNPSDNLDISGVRGCDGADIAAANYMDAADGATIVTGCVRIPAGSNSQSFNIRAVFDNLDEGSTAEELVVEITGATVPTNSGLVAPEISTTTANNSRTANINNVNTARTLAISATTASADEGGDLVFTVTVEGEPVSAAFPVRWSVTTGAEDISGATSSMVNFGISTARTQTQTITLRAADDDTSEGAETVTVTLTDPCAGMTPCGVGGREGLGAQTPAMQLITPTADGTILESDRPVTLGIAAPGSDLTEGTAANFTVSFGETVTTSAAVQVNWAITFPAASQTVLPATAADFTDSSDMVRTSGMVSIPAGMDSAMLPITAFADAVNEAAERFTVTLSTPRGGGAIAAPALHATPTADATIAANDPVTVRLARSGTAAVREGSSAEFTVSLALTADTTMAATSSGDICAMFSTAVSQTATPAAGANPNTAENPDIEVRGCDGSLADISATSQATGGVVISAGQSSATLRIPVRIDNEDEGNAAETLTVALTSAAHTALSGAAALTADTASATAMLRNVNALRTLSVSAAYLDNEDSAPPRGDEAFDEDSASMTTGGEAVFVKYTVLMEGEPLTEEVSVDWSLAGADGANLFGTPASGSGLGRQHGGDHTPDFGRATIAEAGGGTVNANGISGTLVFPVGAPTSRTVRVPLVQDALNEGAERLTLTLTDPCPATGVCTLGGGGGGMTPALQLAPQNTDARSATIPPSDPAMLSITRVGSGTVVSGQGVTYAVSLGNTLLDGRSTPVLASEPLMVMVPLQVCSAQMCGPLDYMNSGQSFTVEVQTGQSSGQAEVSATVLSQALGQSGTPMLRLGEASVTGQPGPSGGTPMQMAQQMAQVTAPDPATDTGRANLPAPVQTAAWELTRTLPETPGEAPEGSTYEVTFTLRGSDTPSGGLSFGWNVTGRALADGGEAAVAADFARAAGYTCGAAAVGDMCTSLPRGTATFASGGASQTIAITVRDDSADNPTEGRGPGGAIRAEGFTLNFEALSGTDSARVEYATGVSLPSALQVDIPALRADLSVANATAAEGASAIFQVSLSGFVGGEATIQPITVAYMLSSGPQPGGAELGVDFTAPTTPPGITDCPAQRICARIPPGAVAGEAHRIEVPLVLDGVLEPRESFTLTITGATGGGGTIRLVPDPSADPVVVANEISATGTITDDADQAARRRQRVGALVTVLDRQTALLATDAISARLSRARTDSAQSASLSIANRNLISARNGAGVAGAGALGGATHLRGSSGAAAGAQDIGLALYGATGQGGAAAGLPGAGKSAGRSAASRAALSAGGSAGAAFGGLGAGLAGNANLGTRTALPSLAQMLNGSSFRFGAASDLLAGFVDFADGIEVWGSGGYVDLRSESRSSGLTYDGKSLAAFIGADAIVPQLPNLLAGLAVGWSAGDLDFTDRAGGFEMRGKLDNDAFSLHPYFGWQLSPHANAWLVLGIAAGSVDIEENEGSGANAISRKLDGGDSSMLMFSTGITGKQQIGETGDLKLRFALTRVHSRVDSGRFDDGALLPKTRGRSLRVGGEAEAGRRITLDNGLSLRPFGTLRVRLDNASTDSGVENAAMDWGAGITAAWTDLGLDGRFAFRRQLNDTGDEEQGATLDVNFAPGALGQGIAISLQTALQQRRPGLANLNSNLGNALHGANSALSNPFGGTNTGGTSSANANAGMQHSLSGEIAYGVALRYFGRGDASRAALLTPYGRFNLGSADTRWAAGLRLANPGGLQLGLEAGLDLNSATTAGGAAASPRSYDLLLTGRLPF